jgi:hypothetical protein
MPTSSNHISRAARQVVPAFLQKLYELRVLFFGVSVSMELTEYLGFYLQNGK